MRIYSLPSSCASFFASLTGLSGGIPGIAYYKSWGWDNGMSCGEHWRGNLPDLLKMAVERRGREQQVVCYRAGMRDG